MDFIDFIDSDFDLPDADDHTNDSLLDDIDSDSENYIFNESFYNHQNVSFDASEKSDGFIPDGKITLERMVSGTTDTFDHYTKEGHDYVKVGGKYIRIDQGNCVIINHIKYETI
jgi:hypothetical protein